eukprot:CAMPEP_0203941454 /NCGR_PEP_ID=MMETSP0359-20131031/77829_1 /ASSEMBLY_ACC=CAM_ASM_000338 /TAXON_ID=268821 /ORGANISM="Scrippsiella Hangoei, Strain SHTV-5" /LENGTH=44 /DNA_ID= /DNA_START= /DNA_END= /DNA_ORIENTATION=
MPAIVPHAWFDQRQAAVAGCKCSTMLRTLGQRLELLALPVPLSV